MNFKKISSYLLFCSFPALLLGQADGYTYKRKLDKTEKESYFAIPLLPEITAQCTSNLMDIRLYNITEKDTSEIPYLMEWMGEKREQIAISFDIINDSYHEKDASFVTLKSKTKQTINQIVVDVEETGYDKNVEVEGSNDNKEWFTIAEHLRIVRFDNADDHFEYSSLEFPNSEYAYFRLKFDDRWTKRIMVKEAYAYENKINLGKYNILKTNKWKQTENKKEKNSEIIVEMPYDYIVNYLTIKSSTTSDFYRNVNIYGSNGTYHTATGDKDYWYLLNTSVLTSTKNNSIHCNNEATKKIKVEIQNNDNAPIIISEIKVFGEQCRLIANLPASKNTYLAYGKKNDHQPVYDIEHFKNKIPASLPEINYGAEQAKITSIEKPNPLIENKKWLWIIMGAVILIIGYFALNMLKKEQE